ncbi:hypothetical protein M2302_002210 [Micromonospora sp. A200]|uniref:hypothetical protein n=1 Tax=Micromonospora sp. A200 TaxID=2940568 RepID=UPI0024758323|nr:hypothetical protein [Micromonospora sp. A200]MDH6462035.1 hypothetical protein [Micromonospora sp. A200]
MSVFSKPSDFAGGSIFKPGEHMNDLALLVEPKKVQKAVPHTYNGVTKTRDEVTADVTVFGNSEALEKGEPTKVLKGVRLVHFMLADTAEKAIGGAFVGVVRKVPTQAGSGYAFRDVDATTEGQVGNYYTNREAAINAALADVPSFD